MWRVVVCQVPHVASYIGTTRACEAAALLAMTARIRPRMALVCCALRAQHSLAVRVAAMPAIARRSCVLPEIVRRLGGCPAIVTDVCHTHGQLVASHAAAPRACLGLMATCVCVCVRERASASCEMRVRGRVLPACGGGVGGWCDGADGCAGDRRVCVCACAHAVLCVRAHVRARGRALPCVCARVRDCVRVCVREGLHARVVVRVRVCVRACVRVHA